LPSKRIERLVVRYTTGDGKKGLKVITHYQDKKMILSKMKADYPSEDIVEIRGARLARSNQNRPVK
jgi:hypothetical protein